MSLPFTKTDTVMGVELIAPRPIEGLGTGVAPAERDWQANVSWATRIRSSIRPSFCIDNSAFISVYLCLYQYS